MIATIAAIALRLYGNRTLKRDDRCDCCDCNRRGRKIAISTIVAIVKSSTLTWDRCNRLGSQGSQWSFCCDRYDFQLQG